MGLLEANIGDSRLKTDDLSQGVGQPGKTWIFAFEIQERLSYVLFIYLV